MIHAYNELYLNNAKSCLAVFFDYLINICGMKHEWCTSIFVTSGYADEFGKGNPAYISGMSGVELAKAVISKVYGKKETLEYSSTEEKSPEYWAGWALASYQWYYARNFRDIFARISLSDMIEMYAVYHEMDISNFIEDMEARYRAAESDSNLKKMRENRGLSQTELSELSGVNIRNIQMYEQRGNNIDKAQAQILYKLSRVLGCSIENLLENPMM